MIRIRTLNKIKTFLETEYKLDMLTSDVRLAYGIYYAYEQEIIDVPKLRTLIYQTHDMFKANIGTVTKATFERAIYRALEKAFPGEEATGEKTRLRQFIRVLNLFIERIEE
jgi:hypothetical protein